MLHEMVWEVSNIQRPLRQVRARLVLLKVNIISKVSIISKLVHHIKVSII